MNQTEQEPVDQFNSGDKPAYEKIFNKFYKSLCLFANSFLDDIRLSEDVVQDVFITLWNKQNDFININSLKSFLYQLARNKALNHIKHFEVKRKYAESRKNTLESESYFIDHCSASFSK